MEVQGNGDLFHEFKSQADEVKLNRNKSQNNDLKKVVLFKAEKF